MDDFRRVLFFYVHEREESSFKLKRIDKFEVWLGLIGDLAGCRVADGHCSFVCGSSST